MHEKKRSLIVETKKPLILKDKSKNNDDLNRSIDNGDLVKSKRKASRYFN